jgi:hypothetical protein
MMQEPNPLSMSNLLCSTRTDNNRPWLLKVTCCLLLISPVSSGFWEVVESGTVLGLVLISFDPGLASEKPSSTSDLPIQLGIVLATDETDVAMKRTVLRSYCFSPLN